MLENARKLNILPEEQYARKKGKSIDAVLHKVLTLDHSRLTRTPLVGIANDLKNNYDRMIHVTAGLAMRRLGVPPNAIDFLLGTIGNMRHFIRSVYGDSKTFYKGSPDDRLQGGGQWNPASPPMWTAFTIVILTILASCDAGVNIISAISLSAIAFTAILYVDDTDLFVLGKSNQEPVRNILRGAQNLMKIWTNAR